MKHHRSWLTVAILLVASGAGTLRSDSATWYVATNGSDAAAGTNWVTAKQTIQAAVDAASASDTVLVSNGVYQTGGRKFGSAALTNRVVIDKVVTVESVNGPSVTTIKGAWDPLTTNGNAAVRGVQFTTNGALIGFTVTNGATLGTGAAFQIDQRGGGILCVSNSVVSNCVIVGNQSSFTGGGVQGGLIYRSTIRGNRSANGGGARLSTPVGTLFECLVAGNTATNGGGGVHSGEMHNSLIVGNVAGGSGGGANSVRSVNCTVVSNTAASGGGIFQGSAVNSIVYFNINSNFGGTVGFTNSCTTPLPSGINNITNDPVFVNAATGNFRLVSISPAIDAGDNTAVLSTNDRDGGPRILNGAVDLGAHEYSELPIVSPFGVGALSDTEADLRATIISPRLPAIGYHFEVFTVMSFANTNALSIPSADAGAASPYPSPIEVAGDIGSVVLAEATLDRLSHTFPSNLDVLLAGPQGQSVVVMSDVGGGTDVSNVTLTFGDNFFSSLTSAAIESGVYFASNIGTGDVFPAPASTNNRGTNLAVFAGTSPTGTWSLFVVDDSTGDGGSLAGWSVAMVLDSGLVTEDVPPPSTNVSQVVTNTISGLTPSTRYAYRAVVSNEVGVTRNGLVYFTTRGPPSATTLSASSIFYTTAVLRALVDLGNADSVAHFEYGTSTNYGLVSSNRAMSASTVPFQLAIGVSNLLPGTTYHVRAVVSNEYGVAFGENVTFATPPVTLVNFVAPGSTNPAFPFATWETAATTIQDAIDVAVDGATIWVTNGVYATGSQLPPSLSSTRVALTKPVTVRSVNGPAVTQITGQKPNGSSAIRCAYVGNGAELIGFTLSDGGTMTNAVPVLNTTGGGAFCEDFGRITHCIIRDNTAHNIGGGVRGGTIINSVIVGNTTKTGGGAAYSVLVNCTVVSNTVTFNAGGTFEGSALNSIILSNTSPNYSATVIAYSLSTPLPAGSGNTDAQPLFANYAARDFRLLDASPGINAGSNTAESGTTELNGSPRLIGATVDMGAHENPGLTLDQDSDGLTDFEEYIADTSPTNSASFFPKILLTNAPAGQTALVIAPTSTGRVYGVYANTNLVQSPQTWTLVLPEQTGTASALTLTITNALPSVNYRTGVRLP